jgi:hypothetical protein
MVSTANEGSLPKSILRFKARVENGVIIPEKAIAVPPGQTYLVTLQLVPETDGDSEVDALAEISAMAEPLGPVDLARNFDTYTGRVIADEPTN